MRISVADLIRFPKNQSYRQVLKKGINEYKNHKLIYNITTQHPMKYGLIPHLRMNNHYV